MRERLLAGVLAATLIFAYSRRFAAVPAPDGRAEPGNLSSPPKRRFWRPWVPRFVPEDAPEPPRDRARAKRTTLYATAGATASAAAGMFVLRYRSRTSTAAKSDAKGVTLNVGPSFALALLATVVVHKSATDCLTNWTRQQTVYSGLTAAILTEVVKLPMVLIGIAVSDGVAMVGPTFLLVFTDKPYITAFIALMYSVQNVLYFPALSNLSAASYQILSQSKVIFTAVFMYVWMKTVIGVRRWIALLLLIFGSVLVQVSESNSASGGNALYGGGLTILSAFLASVANVWYEKLLKTAGENMWVRNLEITFMCTAWLVVFKFPEFSEGDGVLSLRGFTPAVWMVVALKAMNCILVPAALKYTDNLSYQYTKPASIVLSVIVGAAIAGVPPGWVFLLGALAVLVSMLTY
jgi:UDP-sugar transporter A1/2/3